MTTSGGEPLVSVVTPVFNGESGLAECIESVLGQTYENFEYVIVNNRSTDRTLEIAKCYADRDPRIRIHDNATFVEAVENHEIALRQMSPESRYCKVVQADDWIFPECLERMVELAEAHPSVSMVSAYRLEDATVTLDGLPYPSTVVPGSEICRLTLLGGVYVFGTPTSLLIRSDVIRAREPFYDGEEFPRHCDTAVCYEVLRGRDLGFVHQVLTFTRRRGSVQTPISRRMGSSHPEHLGILKKYGPLYLTDEEYERRLGEMTRSYYRFLGANVPRRHDRKFWAYHRRALRNLGLPGGLLMIAEAAVAAAPVSLLQFLLSPKAVAQKGEGT